MVAILPPYDWEPVSGRWESLIPTSRRLRCSEAMRGQQPQNVLFVGAERPDEFTDALRLARQGHQVAVVNPRATAAARVYKARGGSFLRTSIESLPSTWTDFDLICENYPYPRARRFEPARAYVVSRLTRLAPGGRWIVITEHPRFAAALRAAAAHDDAIRQEFTVRLSELSPWWAPLSGYVRRNTRFRLVFMKRK